MAIAVVVDARGWFCYKHKPWVRMVRVSRARPDDDSDGDPEIDAALEFDSVVPCLVVPTEKRIRGAEGGNSGPAKVGETD